jgi:hypothetical protein
MIRSNIAIIDNFAQSGLPRSSSSFLVSPAAICSHEVVSRTLDRLVFGAALSQPGRRRHHG